MQYNKKSVRDVDVRGKKVLIRCDFNVPQDADGVITNDKRIREALPTLQYLLDQGAAVIVCSHLGKPKGERKMKYTLTPIANHLAKLLGVPVKMSFDTVGKEAVRLCRACRLHQERTCAVPGEGDRSADIMLIGEGPGEQEDLSGRPFVGPAGQLLDRMLASIGLAREDVYICNIVKCRPPHNRQPERDEAEACLPYLRAQVALVRPRIIILLGATAARNAISPDIRITRDRGSWFEKDGVQLLVTYHPSALLRDASLKRAAWEDMLSVRERAERLGILPARGANA